MDYAFFLANGEETDERYPELGAWSRLALEQQQRQQQQQQAAQLQQQQQPVQWPAATVTQKAALMEKRERNQTQEESCEGESAKRARGSHVLPQYFSGYR